LDGFGLLGSSGIVKHFFIKLAVWVVWILSTVGNFAPARLGEMIAHGTEFF